MVRRATPADADAVAVLLDEFNLEFQCPTPGSEVLARRLRVLLAGDRVAVFLAGQPAFAVAVVTFRPNVWYDGPVALLDELYVAPAHRNRGTGAQLLAAVEDVTRSRGGALVEIGVDGGDRDARRFYERHGYRCIEPGEPEPGLRYFREFTDSDGRTVGSDGRAEMRETDRREQAKD